MSARAMVCFLMSCLLAAAAPLLSRHTPAHPQVSGFPGWPASYDGKVLTPLPLTAIETRFQDSFPGRVGRFTDGEREIILRWVASGTRKLHPATDCFKADAYTLVTMPLAEHGGERWSSFVATKGATRLLVRERITDSAGQQWSDASAWYWAVQLGQSRGPWWAVTIAQSAQTGGR